jgi:hypothetical protein
VVLTTAEEQADVALAPFACVATPCSRFRKDENQDAPNVALLCSQVSVAEWLWTRLEAPNGGSISTVKRWAGLVEWSGFVGVDVHFQGRAVESAAEYTCRSW